jgi:hypothetical protein
VTQSGAERRKKKCPGNILTRSRAGQGKESYFNIVDRKKKFPYVGITIQNPPIPKTRKRALVTNTLALKKQKPEPSPINVCQPIPNPPLTTTIQMENLHCLVKK